MKKKIFYPLFIFLTLNSLFPAYRIYFTYLGRYYDLSIVDNQARPIADYHALKKVDHQLIHRIQMTSIERTRLLSLQYVGDQFEFNQIKIELINNNTYSIQDKINRFSLIFSIGDYDSIILHNAINFGQKEFNELDKMASAFAIKNLLKKMTSKMIIQSDLPKIISRIEFEENILINIKSRPLPEAITLFKFENFILKRVNEIDYGLVKNAYQKSEAFAQYYLAKNVPYQDLLKITEVINQIDIDFLKTFYRLKNRSYQMTGFIKPDQEDKMREILDSIQFQYETSLDPGEQDQNYNQFIEKLKNRDRDKVFEHLKNYVALNVKVIPSNDLYADWTRPADLFYHKMGDYKSIAAFYYDTLKQIGFETMPYLVTPLLRKDQITRNQELRYSQSQKQVLAIQYKDVNLNSNINIQLYHPPRLKDAVFLIAVKYKNRWIYTTGQKWIDAGIYKSERTCYHYAKNGCYYAYISNEAVFLKNRPIETVLYEGRFEWNVFYDY